MFLFPWHPAGCPAVVGLLLCGLATATWAAPADPPLSLPAAQAIALTQQPLLQALEAERRALGDTAIAARQLPDPQMMAAVSGLPANGDDAGRLDRERMSQLSLSLQQTFPGAGKRQARGHQADAEAAVRAAQHAATTRDIRQAVALDWLALWRAQRQRMLTAEQRVVVETQVESAAIAVRSGGDGRQALLLAARVEAGRQQDQLAAADQAVAQARRALGRWIGEAADRPIGDALPPLPVVLPLAQARARLATHPQLRALRAVQAVRGAEADLARADYRPDWRAELGVGYRPAFSELVTLRVGVDLPVFTARRQDRRLAAALAEGDAAQARVADLHRRLSTALDVAHEEAMRLAARLDHYDTTLLADGEARVAAALAGWQAGRDGLDGVLSARRDLLDLRLARLALQHDHATRLVELESLGATTAPDVRSPTP